MAPPAVNGTLIGEGTDGEGMGDVHVHVYREVVEG